MDNDTIKELIDRGMEAIEELQIPLSDLNYIMENIIENESDIDLKDKLNYWYMGLNGTGYLDDLKNVLRYVLDTIK